MCDVVFYFVKCSAKTVWCNANCVSRGTQVNFSQMVDLVIPSDLVDGKDWEQYLKIWQLSSLQYVTMCKSCDPVFPSLPRDQSEVLTRSNGWIRRPIWWGFSPVSPWPKHLFLVWISVWAMPGGNSLQKDIAIFPWFLSFMWLWWRCVEF